MSMKVNQVAAQNGYGGYSWPVKWAVCAWLALLAICVTTARHAAAQNDAAAPRGPVFVASVDDQAISPMIARYLERVIEEAETAGANCLVIELDTPGGLMDSTHRIVRAILDSDVPVVVYVSPSGAKAASAGLFITQAGHVAAMADGTRIGAAHPVPVGGGAGLHTTAAAGEADHRLSSNDAEAPSADKQDRAEEPAKEEDETGDNEAGDDKTGDDETSPSSVMKEKLLEDAQAWARSLAQLRGRNAEWAAAAVAESKSATAKEALELNVIDLTAANRGELLKKIDGRAVTLANGRRVTLRTAGVEVRPIDMWWGERVLGVLSSPNVAFILFMLGFYGILFEMYSPGWGVPGTIGAICLLLGFFGLAYLPIDYVGLGLILAAMGLFVAEAFVTSFGMLAAGGVVCLILGGLMLVDSPSGFFQLSAAVVVPIALATAAITVFLVSGVIKTFRQRVQTGGEDMLGRTAYAIDDFTDADGGGRRGMVSLRGERWKAVCDQPVEAGKMLRVTDRDGLTLTVTPVSSASSADSDKRRADSAASE